MFGRQASKQPVAAVPAPATQTQPAELSGNEKWLAGMLIAAGLVLILVLLSAFMWRGESWSLISKESTETTAKTAQAGEKKATTTEYSSTVLIAGLGLGSLFLLSGAFYGRIREITLPGGGGIKVGDLPPEKADELKKKIEQEAPVKAKDLPHATADELTEEALKQAHIVFKDKYWGSVPEPPSEDLEHIATEAVKRASKVLAQ